MKYAWLIWILITLYGFTPATINTLWTKPTDVDLVITGQQCGCPCAQAIVISGKVSIPEKILNEYPNLLTNQLTLTGNSPFQPYNYEIGHSEILIEGEVVGIDTISCSPTDCEIVPKFKVEKWTLTSYTARIWTWNDKAGMIYLFGVPIGFLGLLTLTVVQKKRK
jgi:hypothetical protein